MEATIKTARRKKRTSWFLECDGNPVNLVSYASYQQAYDAAVALGYTVAN